MATNKEKMEALELENKQLRKALATLERIVSHYGAHKTEYGLPHPQEQALEEARKLLNKKD